MNYDFDLFTLGAGSGGVAASRRAASYGARVALCEAGRVGGTCVLRGCVPKKLLVYGAHFQEEFHDAAGFGWSVPPASLDWPALIARKNHELDRLNQVYERMLRDSGATIIYGRGTLVDPHSVEVDGKIYTSANILLATGGGAVLPAIRGIEHAITSDQALDLPALPRRIIIVGGGYIGVEFAGIFNAVGVQVTLVMRGDNILRGFDADVRSHLADEMRKKGVHMVFETTVRSIEKEADGSFSVLTGHDETLEADLVMYAIGRAPNTAGLGLAQIGVATNEMGAVQVDGQSRTAVPSVFAVGDCTDRMNLTPVAIAEGRAVAERLFNPKNPDPPPLDYALVPTAVFSQPPVGTVGLCESDARSRGPTDVYVASFRPMRHTLTGRDERTMMKLVVDAQTDRVLGCHMVGPDAPEIIQGLAIAVQCRATKAQFDATVGIHPSAAEEFVTMRIKRPPPPAKGQE